MRVLLILLFSIASARSTVHAQTQLELNNRASEAYAQADQRLNEVYQRILKEYASDAAFIANLRMAQRAWITFRDAELKARYPEREPGTYGSAHGLCVPAFLTELTEQRTAQLRVWLTGIPEGDPCTGSVKVR